MNARMGGVYLFAILPTWTLHVVFCCDGVISVTDSWETASVRRATSRKVLEEMKLNDRKMSASLVVAISFSLSLSCSLLVSSIFFSSFVMLILIAAFIYLIISIVRRLNLVHCQRDQMKSSQSVQSSPFSVERFVSQTRITLQATTRLENAFAQRRRQRICIAFIYLAHLRWYSSRTNRRSKRQREWNEEKSQNT